MDQYKKYADEILSTDKPLTSILWTSFNYVQSISDWLDTYVNYISSKLFSAKDKVSQYDIEEITTVLQSALQKYTDIQTKIENDEHLDHDLRVFLIKKIDESKKKVEITKRATFFEAEKSGYDITFSWSAFTIQKNQNKIQALWLPQEYIAGKQTYLEEINNLQNSVYGPRITDLDDERKTVVSLCNKTYQENKQKLSDEERGVFESFLKTFETDIDSEFKSMKAGKMPPRWNISMETVMEWTEHIKKHFYPNVDWTQQIESGKVTYSAAMETKTRKYPDKKEDTINKLLTVVWHEDGTHMIRWDNQSKNWLIMAWPWYEDIEEWITRFNEKLLLWHTLDAYPLVPDDPFIATFIGENFNFKDTYNLIKIIKKLNIPSDKLAEKEATISRLALNLTQIVKSYYPRDEAWSNRKNVIYFRWEKKLIEYLKSLPDDKKRAEFYKKAMSAKVSFEDIFIIDKLFQKLWTDTKNINQNKLVDKVLNVKLQQWAWAFSKKIQEDGTTNLEKNLLQWDFRFTWVEEYTQGEKKALLDIFTMIGYKKYKGKYIKQEEYEKIMESGNSQ